jgi:hypothetical protein
MDNIPPLEKEHAVTQILERKWGTKLIKKRLPVGIRSNGSSIFHEFDVVSVNKNFEFDNNFVGEVKSDKLGSENGYRSTRFCRMITACFFLQKVKAKRKMLIFTDKEFHDSFEKDIYGLLSADIKIELILIHQERSVWAVK